MNTKELFAKRYVRYGLILVTGLFLGWLFFGTTGSGTHPSSTTTHASGQPVWTCAMHPQIRQPQAGKCPICAMDLVPLKSSDAGSEAVHPDAIVLSEEAVALADVQTMTVGRGAHGVEIRLYGAIQADEQTVRSLVSHVGGRIEKLNVHFVGQEIRKGQIVATVYSPDLLNAQQELLEALKMQPAQPALLHAAREKLRSWKLTGAQIAAIEQSNAVSPAIDLVADTEGVVTAKNVSQGDYVGAGSVLFNLSDFSSVWAVFDAYESDLFHLKTGQRLMYTLQSLPGKTFHGRIAFIDPMLDRTTRTAKVRVETRNPDRQLKPGMYAQATVKAGWRPDSEQITIPRTAVLWTGKRSVVYVKQPSTDVPAFHLREVELGYTSGDSLYVVLDGLSEGETIVGNGVFVVDAAAQLEGKRSMMNPAEGVSAPASVGVGHEQHASADAHGEQHLAMRVEGLCDMCRERIEHAAKELRGVSSASWDGETKLLHLNFNPHLIAPDSISQAIAKAGHDTKQHRADDAVYNDLPGCCRYRGEE